jgi:hypothetical protein
MEKSLIRTSSLLTIKTIKHLISSSTAERYEYYLLMSSKTFIFIFPTKKSLIIFLKSIVKKSSNSYIKPFNRIFYGTPIEK